MANAAFVGRPRRTWATLGPFAVMMLMFLWASTAIASEPAPAPPPTLPPAPDTHPLAAFAGPSWSVRDAALSTGERLDADLRFTPLFGGAAVHERLSMRLRFQDTELAFTYETLHAAPDADGLFESVTVGSDATILQWRSRMRGRTLESDLIRRTDGGRPGRRWLESDGAALRWRIEEDREPAGERRMVLEATLTGSEADPMSMPPAAIDGPAAILAPLAGSWRTEARWSSGQALRGRQEMRLGRGGGYLWVDTFARDGDGPEYHRYAGFHARDPEAGWRAFAVDMTGRLASVPMDVREGGPAGEAAGLAVASRSSMAGAAGPVELDQLTELVAADRLRWIVRSRPMPTAAEPEAWTTLMDAIWLRQTPEG
jgi:hypothetical protein